MTGYHRPGNRWHEQFPQVYRREAQKRHDDEDGKRKRLAAAKTDVDRTRLTAKLHKMANKIGTPDRFRDYSSIAIARVKARRPPLLAAYAAILVEVWTAWTEETLTIAPPPAVLKSG